MSLFTRAGQNLSYNSRMAHSVKGLLLRCKKTNKKKREKNLTLSPIKNEVVIDNNNIIIIQKFL